MDKSYFKFKEGLVDSYDKSKSCGIIKSGSDSVYFFLSDLSRLSKNQIEGMKVSFSQIRLIGEEKWASVIVENTDG